MMGFALNTMDFAFKMMNFGRARTRASARRLSCQRSTPRTPGEPSNLTYQSHGMYISLSWRMCWSSMWVDKRGNYHFLMHYCPDSVRVARHAFARSYTGPWEIHEAAIPYNSTVAFTDGTTVTYVLDAACFVYTCRD